MTKIDITNGIPNYAKPIWHDGRRYPAAPAPAKPHYNPSATPGMKEMVAKFASTCCECGERIEAGDEIRFFFGNRRAAHRLDECERRRHAAWEAKQAPVAEDMPLAAEAQAIVDAEKAAKATAPVIADGYYTIKFEHGGHRTLRILTAKQGKNAGRQKIAYLAGPDNTSDYIRFGFVDGATLTIWSSFQHEDGDSLVVKAARALIEGKVDAGEAGRAYAISSSHCCKCGHILTHPETAPNGIGPECAKKA